MGSRVIHRLLVANRGEIAVRIARTCREMGIVSVLARAVDDHEPAVAAAFDEVVSLGGGRAADTYLNPSRIIDAARQARADAIHPGYGFLSERAEMAAAAEQSGIRFVGPRSSVIEWMGSKVAARRRMAEIGVPVVPGYDGEDQSDAALRAEAERIGFPLLVKASGGGGGKGMKRVDGADALQHALEVARRETAAAFGSDRLLLEKLIERARHIEFQIFGDHRGEVVHLFERDCSVQRRHQKVIEESPAPRFPESLRAQMAASALAAARAVEYENAGTVEFIVSGEHYYFLEMNTRLQVEHPVTELVTGTDLVRAQIEIAEGKALPWVQDDLAQRGHAIECRVYAEDPDHGFLPQAGSIRVYCEPGGPGIRVDAGVGSGSDVNVAYDPLLAKLICFAGTREDCLDRMRRALEEFVVLGTMTNLAYLRRLVRHPRFREGEYDTSFLDEHAADLQRRPATDAPVIAGVLGQAAARGGRRDRVSTSEGTPSVWDAIGSWGRSCSKGDE
ncbi:MAG TPA: biotin carboxylase N-terminal domain-containing protein [Thermoanaerobaculia bacterium]|nr:biotin carboxylase N-terminal domain-containing protein [Thermoanaerobaculia bacterium]